MKLKRSFLLFSVVFSVAVVGVLGFAYNKSPLGQSELAKKLSALRSADSSHYDALIDEILEDPILPESISELLRSGFEFESTVERKQKLVAGWSEWTATDTEGVSRPYQIYLPESVAEGAPVAAMIVHMHGSVGRPNFGTGLGAAQAVGYAGFLWPEIAEAENFLIVAPAGSQECKWWTDTGVAHVDAVIRDVRRSIDFPENSIFAAGFSDGGSGCYFRAMAAPDPFAGFIALNGNPTVASFGSKKQIYLPNMAMSKTFAAMTQQDSLYPTKMVLPHIQVALEHNADILTVSYPKMNHQPTYFKEQSGAIVNFIKTNKRKRRDRLRWYAADPKIGKIGGLELLEFVSEEEAVKMVDSNVMAVPSSVRLGIQFAENSTQVEQVTQDSVAESVGVQAGDVLLSFDGQEIDEPETLLDILGYKRFGEAFRCTVRRNGEKQPLAGEFPPFNPIPIYRRSQPTGFAECQFVLGPKKPRIVLKSENVSRLKLWLPDEISSLKQVLIEHNGDVSWSPVIQLSSRELLQAFALKGAQVPRAYVEVN